MLSFAAPCLQELPVGKNAEGSKADYAEEGKRRCAKTGKTGCLELLKNSSTLSTLNL